MATGGELLLQVAESTDSFDLCRRVVADITAAAGLAGAAAVGDKLFGNRQRGGDAVGVTEVEEHAF